jgi:hypothetical protein
MGTIIDQSYRGDKQQRYTSYVKTFRVVAISSNTNSFGLKQVILMAPDGITFKACKYGPFIPSKGSDLSIDTKVDNETGQATYNFAAAGFEIHEKMPNAPQKVRQEVFNNKTK